METQKNFWVLFPFWAGVKPTDELNLSHAHKFSLPLPFDKGRRNNILSRIKEKRLRSNSQWNPIIPTRSHKNDCKRRRRYTWILLFQRGISFFSFGETPFFFFFGILAALWNEGNSFFFSKKEIPVFSLGGWVDFYDYLIWRDECCVPFRL